MNFPWRTTLAQLQGQNPDLYQALLASKTADKGPAAAWSLLGNTKYNPETLADGSYNPNFVSHTNPDDPEVGQFQAYSDYLAKQPLAIANYDPTADITKAGGALKDALDAGLRRGQLTQQGYDAGLGYYNDQTKSAKDYSTNLLAGINSTNQNTLHNSISSIDDQISRSPDNFSFAPAKAQLDNTLSGFNTSLGNNLQSSLASNGFFGIAPGLLAAGRAQGAFNPSSSNDLLTALLGQTRSGNSNRGIGNQGAF